MRTGVAFETTNVIDPNEFGKFKVNHDAGAKRGARDHVGEVVKAFNTWAFKREQPDTPETLAATVRASFEATAPLHFVLYWGKGPRDYVSQPEIQCLEYLASLRARIASVSELGAAFTLIFTDTHAALNGHADDAAERYFADVRRHAADVGFDDCFLSDLVAAVEPAAIRQADEPICDEILSKLQICAMKWYRGEGDHLQGARDYFHMNMIEKRAVERAFPEAIFTTFNSSEYRALFPANMPIFYMYSLRKGMAVKPWFMKAEEVAA